MKPTPAKVKVTDATVSQFIDYARQIFVEGVELHVAGTGKKAGETIKMELTGMILPSAQTPEPHIKLADTTMDELVNGFTRSLFGAGGQIKLSGTVEPPNQLGIMTVTLDGKVGSK